MHSKPMKMDLLLRFGPFRIGGRVVGNFCTKKNDEAPFSTTIHGVCARPGSSGGVGWALGDEERGFRRSSFFGRPKGGAGQGKAVTLWPTPFLPFPFPFHPSLVCSYGMDG